MNFYYIIPVIFLFILSVIDLKTWKIKGGAIPALLSTSFIIVSFILSQNILSLVFSFLVGMAMVDLNVFAGVPDWKAVVGAGAIMGNMFEILIFFLFITIVGTALKLAYKKYTNNKEMPFIPAILISYILTIGVVVAL